MLDSIVLCRVFGPFGALFSSSSSACLCAEVALHALATTKPHCDDSQLKGHKLLQWPCGQRNYCVTFKPLIKSFRKVCLAASGFREDRITDHIIERWSALKNSAVSECRSCFSVKGVIFKQKTKQKKQNQYFFYFFLHNRISMIRFQNQFNNTPAMNINASFIFLCSGETTEPILAADHKP